MIYDTRYTSHITRSATGSILNALTSDRSTEVLFLPVFVPRVEIRWENLISYVLIRTNSPKQGYWR